MKTWINKKTSKGISKIAGFGLICHSPIKKGEVISIKSGHIIDLATLKKKQSIIDDAELKITSNHFISPLSKLEREETLMWLNHSCEPNAGAFGNIVFVAMRNIKKDEEITIDYAMIDDYDRREVYRQKCGCKSPICRKIITKNDWKLPELRKRYKGYFSTYIQSKIDVLI